MATNTIEKRLPLIVIVGPTASGKTTLAIEAAESFGGEIICADSRTIYKGMDIGTAKPTVVDRARVPHWGLDLVEPGERFTVADFKQYTNEKISEIRSRGHIPFLVGGTGLYIDAVLFDYEFGSVADTQKREQLDLMSLPELREYCAKNSIVLPNNDQNKRYIIRAIEQKCINTKRKSEPISNSIIVGIATDRAVLRKRIGDRVEQLFDDGVVDEAILLGEKYGWSSEAMTGNIYRILRAYLDGQLSLQESKAKNAISDWQLAKRQLTWLRRNPYIRWGTLEEAYNYLFSVLAK